MTFPTATFVSENVLLGLRLQKKLYMFYSLHFTLSLSQSSLTLCLIFMEGFCCPLFQVVAHWRKNIRAKVLYLSIPKENVSRCEGVLLFFQDMLISTLMVFTAAPELRPRLFVVITPDIGNFSCHTLNYPHLSRNVFYSHLRAITHLPPPAPWNAHHNTNRTWLHVHRGAFLPPDAGVQSCSETLFS